MGEICRTSTNSTWFEGGLGVDRVASSHVGEKRMKSFFKVWFESRFKPLFDGIACKSEAANEIFGEADLELVHRSVGEYHGSDKDGNDTSEGNIESASDCGRERVVLRYRCKEQRACAGQSSTCIKSETRHDEQCEGDGEAGKEKTVDRKKYDADRDDERN